MITAMMNNEKTGESILFIVLEPILKNRVATPPPDVIMSLPRAEHSGIIDMPKFEKFSIMVAYEPNEVEAFIKLRGDSDELFHWVRSGGNLMIEVG